MPASLYIISAAALWGGIGVFSSYLSGLGFSPMQIVAIRVFWAAAALTLYLLLTNRRTALRIAPRDCPYFIGTGICSLLFFNWCYFNAIERSTLAVAAVLLYTSPVWIVLLAALLFHEPLTRRKMLAVLLTLLGCGLVAGLASAGEQTISWQALLLGLGSGFGYALYSIFGKFALQKYSPATVSVYTFIFAAVGALPFLLAAPAPPYSYASLPTLGAGLGIGVLCCLLPFLLYTRGLEQTEAGKAAVLATVEPAVAALFSVLLLHQPLGLDKLAGMLLILAAILLLNINLPKR